jgi:hypothetical protein
MMKKIQILLLVIVLTACVSSPTKTPVLRPTDVPPTATVEPTVAPTPTETEPAATEEAAPTATEEVVLPPPAGQNSFGEIAFQSKKTGNTVVGRGEYSVSAFAAQCDSAPDTITITLTVDSADIYKVNYVYRMVAIDTPLITTGWSGDAKMEALGDGKFKVDFSASQVPGKARTWKAWFDVQFIAFDNSDVTFTSPAFVKLITYTYKCP